MGPPSRWVRTQSGRRRTPPAPSVRPCVRAAGHGQPHGLHVPAPDRTARQCACSLRQPQPLPASGPVRRDTCTRAGCRNGRKPGPCPMSARSCPASTMDATIGQALGHRLPRRIRPDTVHSTRHAMVNRKRRDRERTNGTEGVRISSIATTTRRPARKAEPLLWGRRLRLGNQGWLGDGKTASMTVTTTATRPLLGIALPSKPRLGALLSSDDCGSSVERTATLHPL